MHDLDHEIRHASRFGSELPAPQNESNTCEWVILPLLWSIGYERFEIASRSYDSSGKIPDYTISYGKDEYWYLEAKAWKEELSSLHVDQAINYAHSNGKRWVVLTNGREWQLYDDSIPGKSADRLVCKVTLAAHQGIKQLLEALSKESMISGSIQSYASSQRLRRILDDQLGRLDSELMRVIVARIRDLGIPTASEAEVFDYFQERPKLAFVSTPQTDNSLPSTQSESTIQESSNVYSVGDYDRLHIITPVSAESGRNARMIITELLDRGWYLFGDTTNGRKRLKAGDRICFYESGAGVVAECTAASATEIGTVPGLPWDAKYRWRFRVEKVRYFFDQPVRITAELRSQLKAFEGKDPNSSNWSWFVQGTGFVGPEDFALLTGRKIASKP